MITTEPTRRVKEGCDAPRLAKGGSEAGDVPRDELLHPAREVEDDFAADEGQLRMDLIHRVRAQIALGMYEDDRKVAALLDELAADLTGR